MIPCCTRQQMRIMPVEDSYRQSGSNTRRTTIAIWLISNRENEGCTAVGTANSGNGKGAQVTPKSSATQELLAALMITYYFKHQALV